APLRHEMRLHLFVEPHVGTPESVDRLLRITDDEHLAGNRACRPPIGRIAIVEREQQEDLDLERIGVLELVDEDATEARLELSPHARRFDEEPSRPDEEI